MNRAPHPTPVPTHTSALESAGRIGTCQDGPRVFTLRNRCLRGLPWTCMDVLAQVLAESEGFEPPNPCGLTVFKTAAFDRSANSPFPSEARILPPGNRPVGFTMVEPTSGKTSLVKIYGRLGSAEAYQLRDFLHRCDVPFEWIPLESDAQARLPVCEFPDGTRMESPTIRQVIEKLGWFANPSRAEYDLAIYGAGPAGLSAAVYGSSDGLKTVLVGAMGDRRAGRV